MLYKRSNVNRFRKFSFCPHSQTLYNTALKTKPRVKRKKLGYIILEVLLKQNMQFPF